MDEKLIMTTDEECSASILPAGFSKKSRCMTFIDKDESTVLISQLTYLPDNK